MIENGPTRRRAGARGPLEATVVLVLGATLVLLLAREPVGLPLSRNASALLVWMWLPTLVIVLGRRDFAAYGVTLKGWRAALPELGRVCAVTLPPYVVGMLAFSAVARGAPPELSLPGGAELLGSWLSLTLFVALPEEYFFRGYLLTEYDRAWGRRWRLFGARAGPGLVVSSVVFALSHVVLSADAWGLLVVVPGLVFGWLREKTGGLLAPTLYHGLGNLLFVELTAAPGP